MITICFGSRRGTALLGVGLLVAGVALGLFATYRLGWGSALTAAEARQATTQVRQAWEREQRRPRPKTQPVARPPARPTDGQPIALLRVPALALDYEVAVVQGVGDDVIDHGLAGHFPGSALPGQAGNFAVAGHRVTHGEPFRHLDRLRPGDPIVVETADTTYTYLVMNDPRRTVVGPDDTWVTDPVPGSKLGTPPRQALLTLATCPTVWNAQQRMVVFARLATAGPKPAQ
ncbi:class E sortase [Flindersiella endophytica]